MNLPRQVPMVYAAAFLVWGIASREILVACLAALALELPRLTKRTFDVDARAFRMAWLMALLLEWILAINGWLEYSRMEAIRSILKWTPMALFPIAMASALARVPGVPASALLLVLRHRYLRPSMGGVVMAMPRIDPFLPFTWILLLSASYQDPGRWFYPAAAALTAVMVVGQAGTASERKRAMFWILIAAVSGVLCYVGIMKLYRAVENAIYGRIQGPSAQEINRTVTRIGSVDEVKVRRDILWRVTHESGPAPSYLLEATYDVFDPLNNIWNNSDRVMRRFDSVPPAEAGQPPERWEFKPNAPWHPETSGEPDAAPPAAPAEPTLPADYQSVLRVRGMADYDFTVLPLPYDAAAIDQLPAFRVDRNGLGVVRADSSKPVLDYRVFGSATHPLRPSPEAPRDLAPVFQNRRRAVGPNEPEYLRIECRDLIRRTAESLGLKSLPPDEAAARVAAHFSNFTYTREIKKASLRDFLEIHHRGHCEYFATATVLLLREAGIPARYHTGFALAEYNAKHRSWNVRGSHAHAWASAWIDGQWQVVDTTPPDWLAMDASHLPPWQQLADWWDDQWMAFQDWRSTRAATGVMAWLVPSAVVLAIVYTVARFWIGRKKSRHRSWNRTTVLEYAPWDGQSRWLDLLPRVERVLGPRPAALPPMAWVQSITHWPHDARDAAATLVADHYRRRFGPDGSTEDHAAAGAEATLLRFLESKTNPVS